MLSPRFLLLLSVIAMSFTPILISSLTMPPSVIGMYRLWIVLILFLPLFIKDRKHFHAVPLKSILLACLSGLFLAAHFLLGIIALRYTTIASNTILITLEPLIVFIGSILLFKDKLNLRSAFSMIIAMMGALWMALSDFLHTDAIAPNLILGDALTILGTISISIYMLIGQFLVKKMHVSVYNFYVFAFSGTVLLLTNVIMDQPFIEYSSEQWGYLFLLAIVPTIFGIYLQNWLLKHISALVLSVSILGIPIGSNILVFLIYGHVPTLMQIGACMVTMIGVWMFLKQKGKPMEILEEPETGAEKV
ncbi:DMT family transporter [Shimazuella kribbensis]|uniref:DMT family transporter n=1 Tax=Shimazuella kribbensis TaxID=139808 RepID=UPI00041C7CE5|nr:DMT family transporter [Shimazuella kribbensis]